MHALFEDAGKFHAGRILSETDSSAQVEPMEPAMSKGLRWSIGRKVRTSMVAPIEAPLILA